jgi:hypothetical protein
VVLNAVVNSERLALLPGPFAFDVLLRNNANEFNLQVPVCSRLSHVFVTRVRVRSQKVEVSGALTAPSLRVDGVDKSGK